MPLPIDSARRLAGRCREGDHTLGDGGHDRLVGDVALIRPDLVQEGVAEVGRERIGVSAAGGVPPVSEKVVVASIGLQASVTSLVRPSAPKGPTARWLQG